MIRRLTSTPTTPPEISRVPGPKRVAGDPGTWRVQYTEEEYCRILEGRSLLTASDGTVTAVGPGDEFVIPRGFIGTWQVIETTRKTYVIYEAGIEPGPSP